MEKRQRIEEALKEIGIYTVEDLNRAIKEEKPLTSLNPYDNPADREAFAEIQKQKETQRKESNQNEETEKNSENDIQTEETRETET
nr:MAG TPA: hypothetical protein [Caudoviricetes sp.]